MRTSCTRRQTHFMHRCRPSSVWGSHRVITFCFFLFLTRKEGTAAHFLFKIKRGLRCGCESREKKSSPNQKHIVAMCRLVGLTLGVVFFARFLMRPDTCQKSRNERRCCYCRAPTGLYLVIIHSPEIATIPFFCRRLFLVFLSFVLFFFYVFAVSFFPSRVNNTWSAFSFLKFSDFKRNRFEQPL